MVGTLNIRTFKIYYHLTEKYDWAEPVGNIRIGTKFSMSIGTEKIANSQELALQVMHSNKINDHIMLKFIA